jgi:hypothetical protein
MSLKTKLRRQLKCMALLLFVFYINIRFSFIWFLLKMQPTIHLQWKCIVGCTFNSVGLITHKNSV